MAGAGLQESQERRPVQRPPDLARGVVDVDLPGAPEVAGGQEAVQPRGGVGGFRVGHRREGQDARRSPAGGGLDPGLVVLLDAAHAEKAHPLHPVAVHGRQEGRERLRLGKVRVDVDERAVVGPARRPGRGTRPTGSSRRPGWPGTTGGTRSTRRSRAEPSRPARCCQRAVVAPSSGPVAVGPRAVDRCRRFRILGVPRAGWTPGGSIGENRLGEVTTAKAGSDRRRHDGGGRGAGLAGGESLAGRFWRWAF